MGNNILIQFGTYWIIFRSPSCDKKNSDVFFEFSKILSRESELSFNVTGKVYEIINFLGVHRAKSYSGSFVVWFFLIECVRSQSA